MTFYKFAVGVVLTVAMVAVLTLSALVFSSRDFQWGLAQVSPSTNGLISFQRLAEVDAEITQIEAQTAEPRGELLDLNSQIAAIDNQAASAEAAMNQQRAQIVGGIAEVEEHADTQPAASAAADISSNALSQRINALASRSGLTAADQQNVAALSTQVNDLQRQEDGLSDTSAERATLYARQQVISGQVAEANQRIFALQQTVVPDYEHYERVRGEANALQTLSPLGVAAYFAQGHPSILSIALVLLMGALGALLYLFPAYLNRIEPVTMAEIAVRLIFGMCAALAVYVIANAAISGFSLGSPSQAATTSAALNPFTVSLLGIVAGVLSEDIAKWIQDRGRGIFTQGGTAAPARAAAAEQAPTGGLVNNEAIS